MLFLIRLSTSGEFSGIQNSPIAFNTEDKVPETDITKDNHYNIQHCQFNDTGAYKGKSSIDFRNGDGSQYIEVHSCIVTYGRGNYGGGIYFYGKFDFDISHICISACLCYWYSAIAYLNGGESNKYNLTYLTSNQCLPAKHPLYLKNFKEYTYSNVSFTPANGYTYGIVLAESVHDDKKYSYNSFCNNTSAQGIVYFYDMSFNTTASNCNCIDNEASSYSVIIYDQDRYMGELYLHIENFYIYGNKVYDYYYTYHEYDHGKIIVKDCQADNHDSYYHAIFVGENIRLTSDEHQEIQHFSTYACNIAYDVENIEVETPIPFETPFETAHVTPYLTEHQTPFETAFVTPFLTAFQTPFETAHVTPFVTVFQTPFETAFNTPVITNGLTPFETAFQTNIRTPYETNEKHDKPESSSVDDQAAINQSIDKNGNDVGQSSTSIILGADSKSSNPKLGNEKWIIIGVLAFIAIVTIVIVSIYLYKRKNSTRTDDYSETEMVEETVIVANDNISFTIENPLFTTTINGSDDPFKSAFEDSDADGVFHINEN
ncbi:hypothetical protein TVAG_087530 [Trichomonas vaginalis G3]|uniref:Uncharacterized protein n=1 Tax=Trichomonas vaginalis (strain ATCC PRA-98 / G3) TaxID=412133 RepID=A2FDS9_TRIV3|nr:bifunctional inhibitor/lipid-transfer protein/seed storage 2s albumin superfamily protein family [Trichomonas vaginalis G3]EAX96928.1 hypothetical protein TVAG_087530 [Trichomonas vaginalis G3]KAI5532625.1 bifunctional inhibitor/lipid-transfer protein/seed storage 2s albumin superfamily protein family [Trichomonas vaginalis G3]|eukprot:XP_001309858.1 hypothetical protein [Trichomonas vaginalis G3]